MKGLVIAAFGRQWVVQDENGQTHSAVSRGRKSDLAVGDEVELSALGSGQAVIERGLPRRNELRRTDAFRTKLIACNLDQVGIVLAADPPFSEELLLRVLLAARADGIDIALIVNKSDLTAARAAVEPRVAAYRALGYEVFDCSAGAHPDEARAQLSPWLAGRSTLLLGQSGMGKSTLINLLIPDADQRTREISTVLASGKHTTTFTRMFVMPDAQGSRSTRVIDSPGFQSFGLEHLSASQKMHAMPEFAPLLGQCRFNNCTHRDEPGCAIRQAAQEGRLDAWRLELFTRLLDESQAIARVHPHRR